MKLIGYAAVYY